METSVEKLWAHYTTRLLQARKDLRYAFNRRNEECRVNWRESVPARIEDIRMWELAVENCNIEWYKYNLVSPFNYSRIIDSGKES